MAKVQVENVADSQMLADMAALKAEAEHTREIFIRSQAKWTSFCRSILELSKSLINEQRQPQRDERRIKEVVERMAEYDRLLSLSEADLSSIGHSAVSVETPQPEFYAKFSSHNPDEIQELSQSLSMISQIQNPAMFTALRFDRLKESLLTAPDTKVCAILQALKWRMTHTRRGEPRKEVVRTYVEKDVAGLKDPHIALLKALVARKHNKVAEHVVCFANVLASESLGIRYLMQSSEFISLLIEIMKGEKSDSILRQNALGTLQKLSLHRSAQATMIEGGCVEWITETLRKESETLSDYSFEYSTALLMNLALRTAGKVRCESRQLGIVKVLLDHIEHESLQVKTYINGTLYSLLTRPVIKEQAKEYGMEEMIQHMLGTADEQIEKQLRYILSQLQSEETEECLSDNNEDAMDFEEDEEYETENEEEVDEDIRNSGCPVGEQLLQEFAEGNAIPSEYMSPQVHLYKSSVSSSSAARNLPSAMRSRPKIPRTPMSKEILNLVKKENEVILKNTAHAHKNENADKKKAIVEKVDVPEEKVPEEKAEEVKAGSVTEIDKMTQTQQFRLAFQSRTKIQRTPPKGEKAVASSIAGINPLKAKTADVTNIKKKR